MKIKFEAEIRKVEVKKLITNDKEIRILLNTDQEQAIELAKIPTDIVVRVEISYEQ